jgi:cyclase
VFPEAAEGGFVKRANGTILLTCLLTGISLSSPAQDLGPDFTKVKDGIYVRSASESDPRPNARILNSNAGIILTREGVVMIDSGQNPEDSRALLAAVQKLTDLPIRFLINTEPHPDHATGNFVFSPPALVVGHAGATEAIHGRYEPQRITEYRNQSPEARAAAEGFRLVTPHIEYGDRMTLHLGERIIELLYLKNAHSEADTAVWLPRERVLFAGPAALPNAWNRLRPSVSIPDILGHMTTLKALDPEVVIPGHGPLSTAKVFDDSTRFYELLLERVRMLDRAGKSLDQIKQEFRMPEYDHLLHRERIPENIESAYRAVKEGY